MRDDNFERLYAEHARSLLKFLFYRTGNRALAEDLVADTFEKVLRSRSRFDPRKGSEKRWLYAVALNALRDQARRAATEAGAMERAAPAGQEAPGRPGPSDELDQVEDRDVLLRGLGRLSDEEREAIALRYGAELTLPEIAKLLQEKLSTVQGRVYRALRKLKDELE